MHERHYHFYPYKESKDIGITRYRFVAALSERTCGTCGDLDGKVFEVEDAVEGKNYPPIHPNCRCATVMADAISSTRAAKDPLTGKSYKVNGNMTFNKWKDSLTDEQRKAMELHVRQMRNSSADKKQYEKYISVVGDENMPKTFEKFQELKYTYADRWKELKAKYKQVVSVDKSVKSGIISNIELNDIYPSSYGGNIRKEVAEKIEKVLKERNATNLFESAKMVKIDPRDALQTDLVKKGTFFDTILNINENSLGGKTVEEIDKMFKKADSTVANSLREGVIHEEYHARLVRGLNYAQAESLYDKLNDIHIDGISKVAYKNGAECIAEAGVLMARGEKDKLPLEAIELFENYIGG